MAAIDMKALMREELARRAAGDSAAAEAKPPPSPPPSRDALPTLPPGTVHPTWEGGLAPAAAGALAAAEPISAAPPSLLYLPDFLTEAQEEALLACVYAKQYGPKWVTLRARRLQNWGGKPAAGRLQQAEELPPWLAELAAALVAVGVFPADAAPNHVLVNEYAPGQGILAHTDGPLYTPRVATLSLGDPARFTLRPRRSGDAAAAEGGAGAGAGTGGGGVTLVLEGRSLVVLTEEAYSEHEHAIVAEHSVPVGSDTANAGALRAAVGEELPRTGTRVSLTLRHVPQTADPHGTAH